MTLKNNITNAANQALKAGQKEKTTTLRFLLAQIKNEEISKKHQELTDKEITKLINQQVKKLNESIQLFKQGQREDLIKKAKNEIKILSVYLPEQISDKELEEEIEKIILNNPNLPHPGAVIGLAVGSIGERASNQRIAQIIKKKLKNDL